MNKLLYTNTHNTKQHYIITLSKDNESVNIMYGIYIQPKLSVFDNKDYIEIAECSSNKTFNTLLDERLSLRKNLAKLNNIKRNAKIIANKISKTTKYSKNNDIFVLNKTIHDKILFEIKKTSELYNISEQETITMFIKQINKKIQNNNFLLSEFDDRYMFKI